MFQKKSIQKERERKKLPRPVTAFVSQLSRIHLCAFVYKFNHDEVIFAKDETSKMCLWNWFSKASVKFKLFTILCICFSLYFFLFNCSSIVYRLRNQIWFIANHQEENNYGHQLGELVTNSNGSLLYFHLPSLEDYKIERDFFKLNSLDGLSVKFCLKNGVAVKEIHAEIPFYCICNEGYSGEECSIPSTIQSVLDSNQNLHIEKLLKPRRILLSLIWLQVYSSNRTLNDLKIEKFRQVFTKLAQFVDLFIVHEVQILQPNVTDLFPLQRHFQAGSLRGYSQMTLLYPSAINQSSFDLNKIESEMMHSSWNIFTTSVTEYRPEDLILFMSINNFPSERLLLFLKHHTGITDIVHLNPIHNWSIKNWTLESKLQQQEKKIASFFKVSDESELEHLVYHLKNVMISFEYLSLVCRYSYRQFVANYCLDQSELIEKFQHNFWPVHTIPLLNSTICL